MATGLNWETIRSELNDQPWETVERDRQERTLYIGNVFNLYPSGKYYTPWACSNVEVCSTCANDGPCDPDRPCVPPKDYEEDEPYHCEVCRDTEYQHDLESEAREHGMWVGSGEGDPCDIYVGESRDIGEEEEN